MQGDTCSYCKKYNRVDELHKTNRHPLWQKWLYCHGKGSAGGPWNGETRTNGQIKGGDEDHREHGMYPIRHAVGAAAKSYCNYSKNWKTDSTEGKPHKSQPSGGSGFRTQEGWEDQIAGSEKHGK